MRPQAYEEVKAMNARLSFEHYSGQHEKLVFGCPECTKKAQGPTKVWARPDEYCAGGRFKKIQVALSKIDTVLSDLEYDDESKWTQPYRNKIQAAVNEVEDLVEEISEKEG